eukprot:931182-Pleurochrysis_carterae.AAC.1
MSSVQQCDCKSTFEQRTARAHQPQPNGEIRACDCCGFARQPGLERAEFDAFSAELAALKADATQQGKKKLAAFMSAHKRKHRGTPPGPDGTPFTSASLLRWIVDLLH